MTNADAVELAVVPESVMPVTVMSGPVSELMRSVTTAVIGILLA